MQSRELRTMIDSVAHAASRDLTRPSMTRILLEPDQDKPETMRAIATDGHRLAVAAGPSLGLDFGLLALPAELKKLPKGGPSGGRQRLTVTDGTNDVFTIEVSKGAQAVCYRDGASIEIGHFPKWRQVVPMDRKPSGMLFASEGHRSILAGLSRVSEHVTLSLAGEKVIVEASATGFAAKLELCEWDGSLFEPMRFNTGYLADAIEFARTTKGFCMVQFQGADRAAVFGDAHDFALVMPARY